MARRKRKVLPFPGRQQPARRPITSRKVSDRDRLTLEKGLTSFDAVVDHANIAANEFVRSVMTAAGCDPEEGWMFNRGKMQWEKHPVAKNA